MSPTEILARLARRLADPGNTAGNGRGLSMGDHAALRRMDPLAPGKAATVVYRLLAELDVPLDHAETVQRWTVLIHALALVHGAHEESTSIGTALIAINFGEARLEQILSADFGVLADIVPRLARRLHSKSQRMDFSLLSYLLLNIDRDAERAERARQDIAKSFVIAAHHDKESRKAL
jgi:hypothetical protein